MQKGHLEVRKGIIAIVLGLNQTVEQQENFKQYFGLGTVAEWSRRMEHPSEWGTPYSIGYYYIYIYIIYIMYI